MNITSAAKHWRALAHLQADFLLLSEARATATEQHVVSTAVRTKGWRIDWSPPVNVGPAGGMAGRSGGAAVMHSNEWTQLDEPGLQLEAPRHHYQAGEYHNRITGQRCIAVAYYGHPEMRPTTLRDIRRLEDWVASLQVDWFIGGDLNIDDMDEFALPVDGPMLDIFYWRAMVNNEELKPTFHGAGRPRRLDRLFVPSRMLRHYISAEHDMSILLPGHAALYAKFHSGNVRTLVQIARPAVERPETYSQPQVQEALQQAVEQWEAVDLQQNIDTVYVAWSDIWEQYLCRSQGKQRRGPATKGVDVKTRACYRAPLQVAQCLDMRKLSNYVNNLRILIRQIDNDEAGTRRRWRQLANNARGLAERYGVPDLQAPPPQEQTAATRHILETTLAHYQRAWDLEIKRQRVEARQSIRSRLAEHGGINRAVARLLKGEQTIQPRVEIEGRIVDKPEEVIEYVQQAWRGYFDKNPEDVTPLSLREDAREPRPRIELPPITGRLLRDVLREKNKNTAAGRHSWNMRELNELPEVALDGLAAILTRAVAITRLPKSMTGAWMAMVPKSTLPSPPLGVRPISILSSAYRLYASARTSQLQGWARSAFHDWQKAHVKGRSPRAQLARLSHLMDDAKLRGEELHVISMDASKAFPSVSRKQVRSLLLAEGYPSELFDTVESMYQQGGVRLRYQGSEVSEDEFKVCSGIHQGCPLSVLSFNILLAPLCRKLEALGLPEGVVFADDMSFAARSCAQRDQALRISLDHMQGLGIQLNKNKTQYWSSREEHAGVWVGQDYVETRPEILILAMKFGPLHRHKERTQELLDTCRKSGTVLSNLPMTTTHRAAAMAGIVMPRLYHCPWNSYAEVKHLTAMRKDLINATHTYLTKGCRSAPAVAAHILKGHALDPLTAPMMRMLVYLELSGPFGVETVGRAYDSHMTPSSLASTFAANIRRLGGDYSDGIWTPTQGQPLSIIPPPGGLAERKRWLHQWRVGLREASVGTFSGHRHEFRLLRGIQTDQTLTFRLQRRMAPGREKAALEVALMGGLLTNGRTQRHKGPPHNQCPWGCPTEDTEEHRYWYCPQWQWSRNMLDWVTADVPAITRLVGWIPTGYPIGPAGIAATQRHMMRVVLGSTTDFQNRRRRDFEPDYDDLGRGDNGDDDDHDGPPRHGDGELREDGPVEGIGRVRLDSNPSSANAPIGPSIHDRNGLGGHGVVVPELPPRLRQPNLSEPLPDHIRTGIRRIPALPHYQRALVSCKKCGAVGARTRLAQLLRKHNSCVGGVGDVGPVYLPLSVFEERLLRDSGTEWPEPPPNKRRRRMLEPQWHVDSW